MIGSLASSFVLLISGYFILSWRRDRARFTLAEDMGPALARGLIAAAAVFTVAGIHSLRTGFMMLSVLLAVGTAVLLAFAKQMPLPVPSLGFSAATPFDAGGQVRRSLDRLLLHIAPLRAMAGSLNLFAPRAHAHDDPAGAHPPHEAAGLDAAGAGQERLSVVMPVYNELCTIREIFRRVLSSDEVYELVIVDDYSNEGTYEILQELVSAYRGRVRIVLERQAKNAGKGAALRRGFARITGDIVLVQDADLEYDPGDYPKLVAPLRQGFADVVYGSRFAGYPRRVHRFWHHLANKVLTSASNMATHLNLTDMETCYKAFRAPILKSLPLRSNRFGFEPEITAKVAKLGCRVCEVPVAYHGRTTDEGKKIGIKDAFEAFWIIFKFWIIDDLGPARKLYGTSASLRLQNPRGPVSQQIRRSGPGSSTVECFAERHVEPPLHATH